jgi:hypothetical protein
MLTGVAIQTKLDHLASSVFGADMQAYLKAAAKRDLFGLEANLEKRRYGPLFGYVPTRLLSAANALFEDAHAGYSVNAGRFLKTVPPLNVDVFIVSTEVLSGPEMAVDTIVLHELCHWIIDSRQAATTPLQPDDADRLAGQALYARTDTANVAKTRHTGAFCTLLAAASRVLAEADPRFPDRLAVIESAMRYDLIGQLRGA